MLGLSFADPSPSQVEPAALMIKVEKCLARLRKSLAPATLANEAYGKALDWLSEQVKLKLHGCLLPI